MLYLRIHTQHASLRAYLRIHTQHASHVHTRVYLPVYISSVTHLGIPPCVYLPVYASLGMYRVSLPVYASLVYKGG